MSKLFSIASASASERLRYIFPSFTRSASRTEFAKLAFAIDVGRYTLIGLPNRPAAGFEKSRFDGLKSSGSFASALTVTDRSLTRPSTSDSKLNAASFAGSA